MRIDRDTCEEILLTITRNKTRSLLTAFGVFWGIFMLISMLGGGNGLREKLTADFGNFATNSGFFFAQSTGEAYKGFLKGRSWSLELEDVERIKRVNGVDLVTPVIGLGSKGVNYKENTYSAPVKGLCPEYLQVENQDMIYGRYLNEIDIRQTRKVCVLGERVYESLFTSDEDPCGKYVKINGIYYQVVGVAASECTIEVMGRTSESVTLPISTVQQTYNMGHTIHVACVLAQKGKKITDLEPEIARRVKEAHYIAPNDKQALMLMNAEAMFDMGRKLIDGVNILIWMVGLGTLFAGVIGVSNILMVTVKERTAEFGIRRAIGAKPKDILQQVLAESIVLTGVAGMSGISFAVFLLQMLEEGTGKPGGQIVSYQVSFGLAIGTCVLLVVLGVMAGLAPAYRAMSIKPIYAIRDE